MIVVVGAALWQVVAECLFVAAGGAPKMERTELEAETSPTTIPPPGLPNQSFVGAAA
jgi:hypothetical protein